MGSIGTRSGCVVVGYCQQCAIKNLETRNFEKQNYTCTLQKKQEKRWLIFSTSALLQPTDIFYHR